MGIPLEQGAPEGLLPMPLQTIPPTGLPGIEEGVQPAQPLPADANFSNRPLGRHASDQGSGLAIID
jgi:hypothetical protein